MKFVIITILFIAASIWLKSRESPGDSLKTPKINLKKKLREKRKLSANSIRNPYHAVSIYGNARACSPVLDMGDRRFLPVDAPVIPLPSCTSPHCNCKYLHHKDRRCNDDRRAVGSGLYVQFGGDDRRGNPGRRKDDLEQSNISFS